MYNFNLGQTMSGDIFSVSSDNKLFTNIRKRLDYLSQRQKVITENIANTNTPGYQAQDLEDNTRFNNISLRKTSSKHIASNNTSKGDYLLISNNTGEEKPNGNNVSIEQELMKQSTIQIDYQAAVKIYKHISKMMRNVVEG